MFFLSTQFLLLSLSYLQLLLPLIVLGIACYSLILKPQKVERQRIKLLEKKLLVGAVVTTSNGLSGTLLYMFERSLVIELASGEKVEILKQVVSDVKN